jgi:hypothetical protein
MLGGSFQGPSSKVSAISRLRLGPLKTSELPFAMHPTSFGTWSLASAGFAG